MNKTNEKNKCLKLENFLIFLCPYCSLQVEVEIKNINCGIFRHGVYKKDLKQIPPHLKKEKCDELFQKKLIYGCGKPFKIIKNNEDYNVEICDYI